MQATEHQQTVDQVQPETKRDRVRRLFIAPLAAEGMRFERGTSEEVQVKRLNQMADDLTHLSDVELGRLRLCMRSKGDGTKKTFWPGRVSILGFAESVHPRPIADLPRLKDWFISAAGREAALVEGRLVAEFEFWTRHKHPPYAETHKRLVASRASEIGPKAARLVERRGRGALSDPGDIHWLARFEETEAMLRGWLAESGGAA
ncbi:hypothetical protein HKX54_02290 [Sulfitobacter sp. M57]|uniref:hypothetical protein n=1 Tax=unclassified Sulfitobacter TaxID=196795 RepID=UPI0023E29B96|nr:MULTISPECIES: hypothetical protein [unclassified Sulfitobacter]MDF3413271.1 hypothetical protein [Sulfitobacter sp. KE5]MDF3421448.1 hypothetical protein [Sulfitobacter sp. KE43]MDF3431818.1 hypothetical protein [Sulfitobacter sp. KE42]MDF3457458.1 hypothetical protein [Sulfitobacter sp. S74]MDF3461361.1 hypothetical protein [Sulfitobacter sp. Ks18]